MFSASTRTPGSRPSTSDSQLRKKHIDEDNPRPKSAGPAYDPTDAISMRIGSANDEQNQSDIGSTSRLVVPETVSNTDDFEMHPHVPTPELGYYDDLSRMFCIIY